WRGFTSAQATTVALATLLSLAATAPAAQLLARRGIHYRDAGNPRLLTFELRRLTALGAGAALAAGVLALAGWPLLAGSLSSRADFAGFYCLLALLWLAIARVEALGWRPAVTVATTAGLAVVYALHRAGS